MPTALGAAVAAGDFVSFKTQLENALIAESEVMTDTFGALEAKINQSPEFGGAVLRESERRFGRPGMDDRERELAGRKDLVVLAGRGRGPVRWVRHEFGRALKAPAGD